MGSLAAGLLALVALAFVLDVGSRLIGRLRRRRRRAAGFRIGEAPQLPRQPAR